MQEYVNNKLIIQIDPIEEFTKLGKINKNELEYIRDLINNNNNN